MTLLAPMSRLKRCYVSAHAACYPDTDAGVLCLPPLLVSLEEDERPHHDVPAVSRLGRRRRVDTRGMERPAGDGTVRLGVITFQHRNLGGRLVREPVPLVVGTVSEARGLADAVVVNPVVGDIRLVRERRPGA